MLPLLLIFMGLGLRYDFNVPLFEKPDELKHFAVIQYIQSHHALPIVIAGVYEPWDQEGTQPPFYHLLAALATNSLNLSHFTEPARNPHYVDERSFIWRERGNNNLYLHPLHENQATDPVILAARLARWLSLACGLLTLSLTYALARLVLGHPRPALFAAALVAFIPQFLHTSTAITNDSLSTTLAVAALWLLARCMKTVPPSVPPTSGGSFYSLSPWERAGVREVRNFFQSPPDVGGIKGGRFYSPWVRANLIALGLILGLGAITKLSLLYLLPLVALGLTYHYLQNGVQTFRFARLWYGKPKGLHSVLRPCLKAIITDGLILALLIMAVAGWWYLRNGFLYGDPTALNAHLLYRGGALNPTPTLYQIWQTELTGLELSFWAAFGAGQILLEPQVYALLSLTKYVVLAGLLSGLMFALRRQAAPGVNYAMLILLTLWTALIFIALLRWMQITPASWGRLLFPALPSGAIITVWALSQLERLLYSVKRSPQSFADSLSMVLIISLFALAVISPFRYLKTTYAHAPLQPSQGLKTCEDSLQCIDLTYADSLRLIGYRVEASAPQPGDWLPITLYWQATRPITQNYSTFIHLLTQLPLTVTPTVIGQVNTYPNHGNWPTSQLPVGAILADTYYVPISPDAPAPAVMQLAMGIFDFDDPQRAAKPALNAAGQPISPIVGAIPLLPHAWPILTPTQPLNINFGDQIKLVGYDTVTTPIHPGDTLPLTFYWQALAAPQQDVTLFIQLLDTATQKQVAGYDAPPYFPTRFWQNDTRLIDPRRLTLPTDLPSGDYTLMVGWYQPDTFARLPFQVDNITQDSLLLIHITCNDSCRIREAR